MPDLRAAVQRIAATPTDGAPPAALAKFLGNATAEGFGRFIESARQGTITAILKRSTAGVQTGAPKILLLNDTSHLDHFGCVLTSAGLREALRRRFPKAAIDSAPVEFTWRFPNMDHSLFGMEAMLMSEASQVVELRTRIVNADGVIINGEGTFFGRREETFALLFFAYAAARMGKPCMMVNNSFSTTGMTQDEAALCRAVLAGIYEFQVREPVSFGRLRDAGFSCRLAADALYAGLAGLANSLGVVDSIRRIFLSGSVLFTADPPQVERAVAAQLRMLAERYPPAEFEYVALVRGRVEREIFLRQGADVGVRLVEIADLDLRSFVDLIAGSHLAVSGRYHYNMAAAVLGVPFVPLQSNSLKMAGLCRELGLPLEPAPYRMEADADFLKNLEWVAANRNDLAPRLRSRAAELAAIAFRTFERL